MGYIANLARNSPEPGIMSSALEQHSYQNCVYTVYLNVVYINAILFN